MIYFTADPHIYHERAVKFPDRTNFTPESWAEMFFDLVNSKVTKHDRLFILGDFALGSGLAPFVKARMAMRPKDIWLIRGNHCASKEVCKKVFGERYREVHECKIKDMPCWLSHYQHLTWPKSHYGSFHLHGHTHDQRSEYYNNLIPGMRSLDVCPESYKRINGKWGIWSEDEVYNLLIARKGHDPVEWYKKQRGEL